LLRYYLIIFSLVLSACAVNDVDRYNYIQKPTENSVIIAWNTKTSVIPYIIWGKDSTELNDTLKGRFYKKSHHYKIENLASGTKYFYQTYSDKNHISEIDYFYTAPEKKEDQFSFIHYGDCGTGSKLQKQIRDVMLLDTVDFGLVAGDVDQGNGDNYDKIYFSVYKDMLKNTCHFTSIGNHDTYYDSAKTYLKDFYLPHNNPLQTERYYSFTWGDSKFICLDSNTDWVDNEDQLEWLKEQLESNDKKWLFVYFHHPAYTVAWSFDYHLKIGHSYNKYEGDTIVRKLWLPLFEKYEVDFVLNGHAHCYQRGELNGVNYVISGGAGTRHFAMDKIRMKLDENNEKLGREFRKVQDDTIINGITVKDRYEVKGALPTVDLLIRQGQYVRFNVDKNQITYRAFNKAGEVIDEVIVKK